jgi:murein DD-endopeptidase MepM/ murein hydrolase activator NlpD
VSVVRTQSPASKAPAKVFSRQNRPNTPAARGVRAGLFYGVFAALFGTNVLTLVGFLMAPDISGLLNGQNEQVYAAYEDRIAQLRIEVDRLHSRQYAQAGDINLQLQELTQQQEVLLEQHQYVKQLAEKAAELGIETAEVATPTDETTEQELWSVGALSEKPVAIAHDAASEIQVAADAVQEMMDDSRLALASISEGANAATDEILGELQGIGIRPEMPADDAVGGPFLPATDGPDSVSIVDDANAVVAALARFKAARGAIDAAPIHRPIAGNTRMSSSYGNRKDPFTGKRAFHSGTDFPAPAGTTVLAAGKGEVSFVGKRSGYGNVVEVTHQGGLVTRYAHLSSFLVKEGQSVATGTPIARVGSTGRSTGPHLHFEVRRKDSAVDPTRYLSAGKRLMRFLGA